MTDPVKEQIVGALRAEQEEMRRFAEECADDPIPLTDNDRRMLKNIHDDLKERQRSARRALGLSESPPEATPLKRGMFATIREWLEDARFDASGGRRLVSQPHRSDGPAGTSEIDNGPEIGGLVRESIALNGWVPTDLKGGEGTVSVVLGRTKAEEALDQQSLEASIDGQSAEVASVEMVDELECEIKVVCVNEISSVDLFKDTGGKLHLTLTT